MSNPSLHFQTKSELLEWFQKELPDSHKEYLNTLTVIKSSGHAGFVSLCKRGDDETIKNFITFLTELNIGNILHHKNVRNLSYEPKDIAGIDFRYDDILLSVKSLDTKDYERAEHGKLETLKAAGGGTDTFPHKVFSHTSLEVEKTEWDTYSYSRTETGNGAFLGSDIDQMSAPLQHLGEFESQANINGYKKVLFFVPYSPEFRHYHALDIGLWYFDLLPSQYRGVFHDPDWYWKLFKQESKKKNIDAIIFAFPPRPLIWPTGCFNDISHGKRRMLIFASDADFHKRLESVFL